MYCRHQSRVVEDERAERAVVELVTDRPPEGPGAAAVEQGARGFEQRAVEEVEILGDGFAAGGTAAEEEQGQDRGRGDQRPGIAPDRRSPIRQPRVPPGWIGGRAPTAGGILACADGKGAGELSGREARPS